MYNNVNLCNGFKKNFVWYYKITCIICLDVDALKVCADGWIVQLHVNVHTRTQLVISHSLPSMVKKDMTNIDPMHVPPGVFVPIGVYLHI